MMIKKNRLKDLIYIQENKTCNRKTIKGLVRTMLEPVLDTPAAGIVMYRLNDREGLEGLIRRLDFANVNVVDFSKGSKFLKAEIWENTEFVYVLTERFGASFIWDYDLEGLVEDKAGFYILYNSRDLTESFDFIKENCTKNLQYYQDTYKPDRRDNVLMNLSLRKVVDLINEQNEEIMVSSLDQDELMKSDEALKNLEFMNRKSRYVSHELRNQLSIIDMYADILAKSTGDNSHIKCIKKAVKIATNSLMELKSMNNDLLKEYNVKDLVEEAMELAKVYVENREIKINVENDVDGKILVDEDKFVGVLVNLVKNATEAILEKGEITVKTAVAGKTVNVSVENVGGLAIDEQRKSKIFEEGFSTKEKGTGLGLYISKKTMQELFGDLQLKHSDEKSTEFEIEIPMVD